MALPEPAERVAPNVLQTLAIRQVGKPADKYVPSQLPEFGDHAVALSVHMQGVISVSEGSFRTRSVDTSSLVAILLRYVAPTSIPDILQAVKTANATSEGISQLVLPDAATAAAEFLTEVKTTSPRTRCRPSVKGNVIASVE